MQPPSPFQVRTSCSMNTNWRGPISKVGQACAANDRFCRVCDTGTDGRLIHYPTGRRTVLRLSLFKAPRVRGNRAELFVLVGPAINRGNGTDFRISWHHPHAVRPRALRRRRDLGKRACQQGLQETSRTIAPPAINGIPPLVRPARVNTSLEPPRIYGVMPQCSFRKNFFGTSSKNARSWRGRR